VARPKAPYNGRFWLTSRRNGELRVLMVAALTLVINGRGRCTGFLASTQERPEQSATTASLRKPLSLSARQP